MKKPFIFMPVEATMTEFYDTRNHLDKRTFRCKVLGKGVFTGGNNVCHP